MAEFSGKQISRAGDVLIQENVAENDPHSFERAMEILSYWRARHEQPLTEAVKLLTESGQKVDPKAVIAKRLKRTASIVSKLRRFSGMKLRTMQDIGGCRAILANEKRVRKLVRELKRRKTFRVRDYISKPKEDGYRSIHLVSDFSTKRGNVMPIELQIRTAAQHSWATAVEIIDLFTGQAIKANRGSDEWRQFFRSASDQFALIEEIPLYNQIEQNVLAGKIFLRLRDEIDPTRRKIVADNAATLYTLNQKLAILNRFNAFAGSLKAADDHITKQVVCGYVLLEIDVPKSQLVVHAFKTQDFSTATSAYLEAEKRAAVSDGLVVALVSTDAVGGIKEAYPNYFADSTLFMRYISASVQAYQYYTSSFSRSIKRIFG